MDTAGPIDYLRRIPFAVASIAELCTKPGSYEKELVERVYKSVRADVERAIELIQAAEKEGTPHA